MDNSKSIHLAAKLSKKGMLNSNSTIIDKLEIILWNLTVQIICENTIQQI